VDLIVRGQIINDQTSFKQDAGIVGAKHKFEFDVTVSTVKIDKILYGSLSEDTFILHQHGLPSDTNVLKEGVQAIFILHKRTDQNAYWPYNLQEGIWKINNDNDTVSAITYSPLLTKLNNSNIREFEQIIADAAKNKKNF
jgi:hypothetical protein